MMADHIGSLELIDFIERRHFIVWNSSYRLRLIDSTRMNWYGVSTSVLLLSPSLCTPKL
jgi:hypothetical protein